MAAASSDAERGGIESNVAPARVSSIEELSVRVASAEDDEDVSLDELLISDADGEEEEEEATDIHPGLSELAESLRPAPVPSLVEPAGAKGSLEAVATDSLDAGATDVPEVEVEREPVSAVSASSAETVVAEESVAAVDESSEVAASDAPPADPDPEEVVVQAAPEDLAGEGELPVEGLSEAEAPAAADASSAEIEAAPESEAPMEVELAPESEVSPESVPFDAEEVLEPEALAEEPAEEVELDDATVDPPPVAAVQASERQTVPETIASKRRDAPLPSFDIPELEAASARRAAPEVAELRPHAVALPVLAEDDDDAVTHMGLPVVPEAANDYPAAVPNSFAVVDPAIAALQSLDADLARGDSRRATTRVIPRLDPKTLPARPGTRAPAGPPLAERLVGLARDAWDRASKLVAPATAEPAWGGEVSPGRQRLSWLAENVLPPLSLVLFGSGLGAGVIMLVDNDEPARAQAVQSLQESAPVQRGPLTLAERARTGDGDALYKITNMPHEERTSSLTLALEAGYQAQKQREFREFVKASSNVAGSLPASVVSRMVEYATSPETMLPAFQELTEWPGSAGPDLLYSIWESAGGSRAASLAQQLLYSTDQRAKATPALLVALDLRSATTCEDYASILPAVVRDGDQRSSATLRALRHNDGCGTDGKQDCYPCLRNGSLLDDALKATERR